MARYIPFIALLGAVLWPGSVVAQQPRWSVVLVATGPTAEAQDASRQVLAGVQERLRPLNTVAVRGDIRLLPRSELNRPELIRFAQTVDANATAVLEFVSRPGRTTGYAHLTVAWPAQDQADSFAQYLDKADVQPWQLDSLAAFITERVSGREQVRVELFIYVVPRGSYFTVGGSDPVRADESVRANNEGFKHWIGTRPAGVTTIELYNLPDYDTVRRQISVAYVDGRPYRTAVEAVLRRRP